MSADLDVFEFVPCGCTHEEMGADLNNQMGVSWHVIETVRKCAKSLKGFNGLCAHTNIAKSNQNLNYNTALQRIICRVSIHEKKRSELLERHRYHILLKLGLDQLKRSCHWTSYGSEDQKYDCMGALSTRPVLRIIFDRLEEISEILKEKREEGKNKNIDTSKLQTEFDALLVEAQGVLGFEMRQLRDEVRVLAILCF